MHDEQREIFVGIARGIAQAEKLGPECLLEQALPLGAKHVIVVAFAARLGEERDGFRHHQPVHAGLGKLDGGVVRLDEVDQPPIGLIDRCRELGGMQLWKIVVGVQFEKHQVINPRFKFFQMDGLFFVGQMMI